MFLSIDRAARVQLIIAEFKSNHSALWSNATEVKFENRVPWMKTMLQDCLNSHTSCVPRKYIPTRLIDTMPENAAEDAIRLVLTAASWGDSSSYTALSHCWGQTGFLPSRTTRQNLNDHLVIVPHLTLTKNISDAIRVTRALGIRYIWIDSLCIIQDDPFDWEQEAAKMADIYQGSEVTIVANDSPDAHIGLFLDCESSTVIAKRCDAANYVGFRPTSNYARADALNKAPIQARAWVLQEVYLSHRLLQFTEHEVFWTCKCSMISEDGYYGSIADSPGYAAIKGRTAPTWTDIVQDYSTRQLTDWSDKLAAFAGITTFWASTYELTPILGMWMETLPSALRWTFSWNGDSDELASDLNENIPSWTWLSRNNRGIGFPFDYEEDEVVEELNILRFDNTWSGVPLTSKLLTATLLVEGWVRSYQMIKDPNPQYVGWVILDEGFPARETSKYRLTISVNFDNKSISTEQKTVELLLLRTTKGRQFANHHFSECLMVKLDKHIDRLPAYSRLGTCEIRFSSKAGTFRSGKRVRLSSKNDPSKLFKTGITKSKLYLV
jgi:hypothetical protein